MFYLLVCTQHVFRRLSSRTRVAHALRDHQHTWYRVHVFQKQNVLRGVHSIKTQWAQLIGRRHV